MESTFRELWYTKIFRQHGSDDQGVVQVKVGNLVVDEAEAVQVQVEDEAGGIIKIAHHMTMNPLWANLQMRRWKRWIETESV